MVSSEFLAQAFPQPLSITLVPLSVTVLVGRLAEVIFHLVIDNGGPVIDNGFNSSDF